MKLQSLLEAINYASDEPKADPKIVAKFADVSPSQRSYYIVKWAEKNGIDSDDAMHMAGYVKDGYIGAGAWNWRYIGEDINEGEERSIIRDACIDKLVDEFRGEEHQFENRDDLEYAIYSELERLDVEDCVDPDMEHGGQRIGDFASGSVINVIDIDIGDVMDDVISQLDVSDLEEGSSPHKKGSAKYKKHMAAKHAAMGEDMEINEKKMVSFKTSVGIMPGYDDHTPLSAEDYHNWTMKTDKNKPKPNIVSQRYALYVNDFKQHVGESINVGDELMIETADGEGIVVPVLHVVGENILVGWDQLAEDIFTEEDRQLAELRKLAGLDEADVLRFAPPDDVKLEIEKLKKNGIGGMSAKFHNWSRDNDFSFSMADLNNPAKLQNIAIAIIKYREETGQNPDGSHVKKERPPKQLEIPFKPRNPEQQELDFDEDLDEAEYRGRKVKLNKPTRGDVKKFKVYVKDPKTGNIKKVNFGHGGSSAKKAGQKTMKIRKSNPKARKSFRARHNCDNPGPKTKARYWSCRKW